MHDIIAALVAFFLTGPLQAEIADRLADGRAPHAVIADMAACGRMAAPLMVQRATSDPWWAASSAFRIWIGTARPEALLLEAAPGCAGAVRAARPFLTGREV